MEGAWWAAVLCSTQHTNTARTMAARTGSKGVHIALWVAQGLLAAAFGMAGLMKLTKPADELVQMGMSFVAHYEPGTVRFIGITEVLAAIGLIFPAALRILPILTPLAATGLAAVMVLATHFHFTHGEPFLPNLILFALSAFVAWGRFKMAPIQARA